MRQRPDESLRECERSTVQIAHADQPCPFFLLDRRKLAENASAFQNAFPNADLLYAFKANSDPTVIQALYGADCGFEAASWFEIEHVLSLGVSASRIVFGTAVKQRSQVARAFRAGVSRFAADSEEELDMLATAAPGSSVFIRAKLDDSHSVFRMNEKFGAPLAEVAGLLRRAQRLELVPWGISFNVGSQATRTEEWATGVGLVEPIVREVLADGIQLGALNLGGGFPVAYRDSPHLPLIKIADAVHAALKALPYQPRIVVEPGRGLVGTSMCLVTSIIARIERADGPWLFLDCGVYNALYEALLHQGRTAYPVSALGPHDAGVPTTLFTLAGPTGDGLDVIARDVELPASLAEGGRLLFENVGAYTHCMASAFNGFPVPPIRVMGN